MSKNNGLNTLHKVIECVNFIFNSDIDKIIFFWKSFENFTKSSKISKKLFRKFLVSFEDFV